MILQDIRAEFALMNNKTYPYVEDGKKPSMLVQIKNISLSYTLIIDNDTEIRFPGYTQVYKPVITAPIVLNPMVSYNTASTAIVLFEADVYETTPDTALPELYKNGTRITYAELTRSQIVEADKMNSFYFTYRMTSIFADNINQARIRDREYNYLTIADSDILNAFNYGWENIVYMNDRPSTSNGPIIDTIDTYFDKLTHKYFYNRAGVSYHSIRQMASDACDDLDSMSLDTTQGAATELSAQLLAGAVDWYCNGALL